MKKVILLAAFALLGSSLVSCDGKRASSEGFAMGYNTDDGFDPPKPTKPPFPPPPPPGITSDRS